MDILSPINSNSVPASDPLNTVATTTTSFFHKLIAFFEGSSVQGGVSPIVVKINTLLGIIAIICIFILAYCLVRMFEIRKKEHRHLHQEIEEYAHHQALREQEAQDKQNAFKNEKWAVVIEHTFSENEADWKLAIIEADAMLENLLEQLGFKGENLGERLKGADPENFKTISYAWEAHLIRNKIAHEGTDFILSHHEAKRVIALYESIFREFDYI